MALQGGPFSPSRQARNTPPPPPPPPPRLVGLLVHVDATVVARAALELEECVHFVRVGQHELDPLAVREVDEAA